MPISPKHLLCSDVVLYVRKNKTRIGSPSQIDMLRKKMTIVWGTINDDKLQISLEPISIKDLKEKKYKKYGAILLRDYPHKLEINEATIAYRIYKDEISASSDVVHFTRFLGLLARPGSFTKQELQTNIKQLLRLDTLPTDPDDLATTKLLKKKFTSDVLPNFEISLSVDKIIPFLLKVRLATAFFKNKST